MDADDVGGCTVRSGVRVAADRLDRAGGNLPIQPHGRNRAVRIVKHSVAGLSDDRRLQALLIAFSFGAFVEGAAGFGTPVAISAALMMGAGFRPLYAAGLALLANTSPVAFGALGTPIITLADVTKIDKGLLSAMAYFRQRQV